MALPLTYTENSLPQRQPFFNVVCYMPTINYVQPQHLVLPNYPHPILTFIIPVILNVIEIKCQCKGNSPFDMNPIAMRFSLSCLMAYCLAYGIELRLTSRHSSLKSDHITLVRSMSMLFGLLSLVSLTSVLFPSGKPFLYGFCGLLSITDILQSFKMVWEWIDARAVSKFFKPCQVKRNILPV